MSNIQQLLKGAVEKLVTSPSPKLDAEILLSFVLKKDRSALYAWPEAVVDELNEVEFLCLIDRRCNGEPIAYIVGYKEFWGRDFFVNKNVLIPRPETELIVEIMLEKFSAGTNLRIIDLGVGSGTIAITLKKERPDWDVYASDIDEGVLQVAKKNARQHDANVNFICANWCDAFIKKSFDVIICNPPYIDVNDSALEEMVRKHEPEKALIANENGLADFFNIMSKGRQILKSPGFIFFEHGASQASELNKKFIHSGFVSVETHKDLAGLDRVSFAKKALFTSAE